MRGHQIYNLDYTERAYRFGTQARLQFYVSESGLYTELNITPTATAANDARPRIAHQVFAPAPASGHAYWNPDGRRIGWEWLIWDDQAYTISYRHNGVLQSYSVPALPASPKAIFAADESVPYTMGPFAGWLYHGKLVGNYVAGGVRIAGPNTAQYMAVMTPLRHNLYRDGDGWRLQLYDGDGIELAADTFIDVPLTVVCWSPYR